MIEERQVAIFLSTLNSYPSELAKEVGLEAAVLWWELFKRHAGAKFVFAENFAFQLGIPDGTSIILKLVLKGYLKTEGGQYLINFDKIVDVSNSFAFGDIEPPWNDNEFLVLISRYRKFLKERGRSPTLKQIYDKFLGVTLVTAVTALKYSLDNKYVTLYFYGKHPELDRPNKTGDNSGGRSGGDTNTGRTGNFAVEEI